MDDCMDIRPAEKDRDATLLEDMEARRKHKNRRSARRWRTRKKIQKARELAGLTIYGQVDYSPHGYEDTESTGDEEEINDMDETTHNDIFSSDQSQTDMTTTAFTPQEAAMLYEHRQLGMAQESRIKAVLDKIAFYLIQPHGAIINKRRIIRLMQNLVIVRRNGPPSGVETAIKVQPWLNNIKVKPCWDSSSGCAYSALELCSIFTKRLESQHCVSLTIEGSTRLTTLERIAALPADSLRNLIANSARNVQTFVSQNSKSGCLDEGKKQKLGDISKQYKLLSQIYILFHNLTYAVERDCPDNYMLRQEQMITAGKSLPYQKQKDSWMIWERAQARLQKMTEERRSIEEQMHTAISYHALSISASYNRLFEAVINLMENVEEMNIVLMQLEAIWVYQILDPHEWGLIIGSLVHSKFALENMKYDADIVLKPADIFMAGAMPRC